VPELPLKLKNLLEMLASLDRRDRTDMLIDLAAKYQEPPPEVAVRPFPESHRVPGCESEAYIWAEPRRDGTLKFHFAVENPQGISAKATAVILDRVLSGLPLDQVAGVATDVIYEIFGRELSMGKNLGLSNMLVMCQAYAREGIRGSSGVARMPRG
jgi:cysteine desulfuration protein SufE